ncbi:hypothetical protein [Pseudomonas sp. Hp2]|uniref:hypothetical protein n=1 Tax=Pseudomonas sp. Hp2 TaxID=701189 RepID=UPI00112A8FDC|nr:hypothetical protein [Pseudomonas sp. Hp2]
MKKNGYDLTTNLPMGAILHDGMGSLVQDLRPVLRELPILEAGAALVDDIKPEDIKYWQGEANQGMTSISRLSRIRQGKGNPELELSLADFSTHQFMFGRTSTGMTSAANNRSSKQRSKYTRKKGRRS